MINDFSVSQLEQLALVIDRFLVGRPISQQGPQSQKSRPGSGLEFLDHRLYSAGDDPRFIDWRMTMKQQKPYVKRFQNEAASNWVICLDNSASMSLPDNEKWSTGVKLAAAWAFILLRKGQRVSLLIFNSDVEHYLPLGRGKTHYGMMINTLTKAQPSKNSKLTRLAPCMEKIPKHSASVVISDFAFEDAFSEGLHKISGLCSDVHSFTVYSQEDYFAENDEVFVVEDIETNSKTLLANQAQKRNANHALKHWFEYLEQEGLSHGIVNSLIDVKKPWSQHMLAHFKKIQRVHA
ncbi:MAG TPA: DUF58 domain-containing protein [Gammaproteobacteria bacterium]|nr:DUF58 domain-containing protein [Gammaproteobacteria bacterium]